MHMLVSSKGLQRALALACCLMVGGGLSGCVSKSKYQRALAANQACQQQVAEQAQRLDQLHASLVELHQTALGTAPGQDMTDEEIVAVLRSGYSERDAELSRFRGQAEEALTYQLMAKYLFPSGSATLTPQGQDALMKVATWLKESEANNIFVQGFTDDVPIGPSLKGRYASNWELSAHRATTVVRFLVDQGVSEDRLIAVAYGEHHPEMQGMTEQARQVNRRIEIKLNDAEFKEVVARLPDAVPQNALIDLNSASVAELIVLPGISPEDARAIVDYRMRAGRINSIDELSQIRGFDAENLEALRTMVTFGGEVEPGRTEGPLFRRETRPQPERAREQDMQRMQEDVGEEAPEREMPQEQMRPEMERTQPPTTPDTRQQLQPEPEMQRPERTAPAETVTPEQPEIDEENIYLVPERKTEEYLPETP